MIKKRKTATLVRNLGSRKSLYKLNVPLKGYGDNEFEYIVVSFSNDLVGPETYIFGSDESGEIRDWSELPGSFQGDFDSNRALEEAGYMKVKY